MTSLSAQQSNIARIIANTGNNAGDSIANAVKGISAGIGGGIAGKRKREDAEALQVANSQIQEIRRAEDVGFRQDQLKQQEELKRAQLGTTERLARLPHDIALGMAKAKLPREDILDQEISVLKDQIASLLKPGAAQIPVSGAIDQGIVTNPEGSFVGPALSDFGAVTPDAVTKDTQLNAIISGIEGL